MTIKKYVIQDTEDKEFYAFTHGYPFKISLDRAKYFNTKKHAKQTIILLKKSLGNSFAHKKLKVCLLTITVID